MCRRMRIPRHKLNALSNLCFDSAFLVCALGSGARCAQRAQLRRRTRDLLAACWHRSCRRQWDSRCLHWSTLACQQITAQTEIQPLYKLSPRVVGIAHRASWTFRSRSGGLMVSALFYTAMRLHSIKHAHGDPKTHNLGNPAAMAGH